MIASYKIDEICHKNEDVCFYVCMYVYIEPERERDGNMSVMVCI